MVVSTWWACRFKYLVSMGIHQWTIEKKTSLRRYPDEGNMALKHMLNMCSCVTCFNVDGHLMHWRLHWSAQRYVCVLKSSRETRTYNHNLNLEGNSLKWGASLPTELPSAVCGIDHLPGVALGPGWKHKHRSSKVTRGFSVFSWVGISYM